MKIFAILYMLACPDCEPVPVAAYLTADGPWICQATAAAQNATETRKYYCD